MSIAPPETDSLWYPHELPANGKALELLDREWLLTNGTGAFAMGTAAGINTRRYHGLLVAAVRPPVARAVILSQLLETLRLQKPGAEQALEFSTCLFRDPSGGGGGRVTSPAGHQLLKVFRKGLSVEWQYVWGKIEFVRRLYLHWGQQAATLEYLIRGLNTSGSAARLDIAPLLALRDFHALQSADAGPPSITAAEGFVLARRGDLSATVWCGGAQFQPRGEWWYRTWLPAETERGQDDSEDLFDPGCFAVQLEPAPEHRVLFTVALGDKPAAPAPTVAERASRLEPIVRALSVSPDDEDTARLLAVAADDFVVDRQIAGACCKTIIAGYPWFADWGRDTFIALPGLLLETRRYDQARQVLQAFAAAMRHGLVPNRFDDYAQEAAHYNTVDASLWFAHAAMQYVLSSGDSASWRGWLGEAVLAVIDAYIHGTDFDIRMAGDGLISAGSEKTQLTWMDAAIGGIVFTPRQGKAVEINALWYHVLAAAAELLGDQHPQRREHFAKLTARIRRSFGKVFWDEALGCLIDHVWTDEQGREQRDHSIRPNQILAVSLPHSPLPRTRQEQVIAAVRTHLLTPYGLRTLPTSDPHYHGRYTGNQYSRDEAYHQGTVWAWLIGSYGEAVLRAGKFSKAAKAEARQVLGPLLNDLRERGLGQIHEIYEGDEPHRPVGCVAQAWSVAEVLRVWRLAAD